MATTTNLEPGSQSARMMAFTTSSAADRIKGLARARRHTRLVRVFRWLFPVTAAGLVAVYVTVVLQTVGFVEGLPKLEISSIIPENLTMHNPRYEGFNKDGGTYVVTAKTAVQDLTDLSRITLNDITGDLTDAKKSKTQLKAAHGFYNSKNNELELYDGIEITSESGMRASLSRATVMTKKNVVMSKEPVTVAFPAGSIRANQMLMQNKARKVTFLNEVVAHLTPKAGDEEIAATGAQSAAGSPIISATNGPIDITAQRLDVDDAKKVATFSGIVRAVQGDAALETAALNVSYLGQMQPQQAATPGAPDGAKIRRIVSQGPVVLTRGTDDRVTGEQLDFDAVNEVTVLDGDVVITSGDDRRVTGNAATMDQKNDTILLTGNVVATQGRNALSGERLFVDRKVGRTQLTSPQTPGSNAPGRIKARFYRDGPGQGDSGSGKKTASATSAAGVFKTDPNAPIDVESYRMEIDDKAKQAVFKGDVRAAQGDFVLRTATLRAYYTGQAGLADQANAATKKQAAELTRIQAQGKVIVDSKNGQKATGDWATFDVKNNTVTLGGDVVLTQDKNIVRGTQLSIDMATGQSVIQNDPGAAWSAKAAPTGEDPSKGIVVQGPTGGRPSAVFYPRQKKKSGSKKSPAPASDTTSGATSGGAWSASTP
jgi:lipopolysaccharide transport protein LptA/LPS export ABC transporter protein LptC